MYTALLFPLLCKTLGKVTYTTPPHRLFLRKKELLLKKKILIWLCQVLITTCGIFSCSMWDPVP